MEKLRAENEELKIQNEILRKINSAYYSLLTWKQREKADDKRLSLIEQKILSGGNR